MTHEPADRPAMLRLGVNIDHVATVREARYRGRTDGEPDPVAAARMAEEAGAGGITAHLREDRRHIQDRDVRALRREIRTRLNLEMANTAEMVGFALEVKPDIVCLVPERREELTTEGGLEVAGREEPLRQTCRRLRAAGIETSLFITPDPAQVAAAARVEAGFIELHTGAYAEAYHQKGPRNLEIERLVAAATQAHALGLQVNAGHGLTVGNVPLLHLVPHLVELNIGHHLISRALTVGLPAAIREMLAAMAGYRG